MIAKLLHTARDNIEEAQNPQTSDHRPKNLLD
jgi:hypothetical protein